MTKSEIESILERVRTWPPDRQEDAARTLLRMEELGTTPYILSPEEERDLAEAEASENASEEEVRAAFERFPRAKA